MRRLFLLLLCAAAVSATTAAQSSATSSSVGLALFDEVWKTINDSFYDPNPTKEYPWSAGRTSDIRKLLEERESHRSRYLFSMAIRELPIIALLLGGHREDAATLQEMDDAATRSFADKVIGRWRENKRVIESIAKARGIRTLFVWQPMPAYGYDGRFHILGTTPPGLRRQAASYEALDRIRAQPDVAQNLLWLADMQRAHKKNLYVDDVHYTEAFSDEVADRIAKALASESGQR